MLFHQLNSTNAFSHLCRAWRRVTGPEEFLSQALECSRSHRGDSEW